MKTQALLLLSCSLFYFTSLQAQNQVSFASSNIASGNFITDMKIVDVNNDSRPDVVWTSGATGAAGVNLANSTGGFQAVQSFAGVSRGKFLALLDYDSDGFKDIMISSCPTNSNNPSYIAVVKGSSSGFTAPLGYSLTGSGERILQAADISGDGIDDLVAAEYKNNLTGAGSSRILVFGIPGNGTLLVPTVYPLTSPPTDFIMADVNGDGKKDVVACSFQMSNVIVMLNTGSGLGTAQYFTSCTNPIGVCTGDFDNDGNADIAVGNSNGVYTILTGDGAGQFTSLGNSTLYDTADYPVAADFDADGNLDLAFGSDDYTPGNGIEVALGSGNGAFTTLGNLEYGGVSQKIHILDVNGDGKPDILGATSNSLIYLRNTSGPASTNGIKENEKLPQVAISKNGNEYRLESDQLCDVEVFDLSGKKVMSFTQTQSVKVSSENLTQGIYMCRFTFPEGVQAKKLRID